MQLQIKPYEKAAPIEWNFEELKAELTLKLETYKSLQYTPEQIASAKTDRAALNNLKKTLSEERLRREREFMEPFALFKAQVNELVTMIDEPVKVIDKQIKEYEEFEKRQKLAECVEIWQAKADNGEIPDWLRFEQVENEKWLNKGFTLKAVKEEIEEKLGKINGDIAIIGALPDYSFEVMEVYKKTLDVGTALARGRELADIQKRKEAAEAARKAEQERLAEAARTATERLEQANVPEDTSEPIEAPTERPTTKLVRFECEITTEQAWALKAFFDKNKIIFRQI